MASLLCTPSNLSIPSSFSLSNTPTHQTLSESAIEHCIKRASSLISKWDTKPSAHSHLTSLFQQNRAEALEFIRCVHELRRAMHLLISDQSASDSLVLAQTLMQAAMKRLESEFHHILSTNRDLLHPGSASGGSSGGFTGWKSENGVASGNDQAVMFDLRLIAECMIGFGYGKECGKICKTIRKSIVDEELHRLGIERLRSKVSKTEGEVLEQRIIEWSSSSKYAVKRIFRWEKILCDHIFAASESITESCFSEICAGANILFKFPEHVAKGKSSPEKIFRLLELHETISDLIPEIDLIFSFQSTSAVRLLALNSLQKVDDAIRLIFSDFESTVQKNSSKTPAVGGGVHQLTRPAMDYISQLADYSAALADIFADCPAPMTSALPGSYFLSPKSGDSSPNQASSARLAWLILVLLCKLDSKAELYKDVGLAYLFLANNLNFVVDRVRKSNLRHVLSEDWVTKHEGKVKQYAANYEAVAWSKVLSSLPAKGSPTMCPETAKDTFRRFNAAFEVAYRKQTPWVVADTKLRDEIKASVAKNLVSAYREFYDAYASDETILKSSVGFTPDNLQNYLVDLFHGTSVSGS